MHSPRYLLVLAGVLSISCGGGSDVTAPPTTGTLEITTSTGGTEPDADGYVVQLDSGPTEALGASATARHTDLSSGAHTVQLSGLAPNCTVAGENPRAVNIIAGETATVSFAITCTATTGGLQVSTSTGGTSPDADGYSVTLDGADRGTIGATASITLAGLVPGGHIVGLAGVAVNCQVQGENLRAVTVTAGATATVTFAVTCATPPPGAGTLRVTTTTTGPDQDADGYTLAVDAGTAQAIGVNAGPLERVGAF